MQENDFVESQQWVPTTSAELCHHLLYPVVNVILQIDKKQLNKLKIKKGTINDRNQQIIEKSHWMQQTTNAVTQQIRAETREPSGDDK